MKRDIRKTATYPHPIEDVWAALTDREALAEWLMPNDFAPVLGHEFTFRTKPAPGFDGIVRCKVLELEPPRVVAYSWHGGGIETVVRFTLSPCPEGTRLAFEQTGFRGVRAILVSALLSRGWSKMFAKLLPDAIARRH
jgi:uncharacterized protein YndB with AHSA1/START domain